LFPLQDPPPALPCCHTRPLAQPCCHTWPPAPRRRPCCHTRPPAPRRRPRCHTRPSAFPRCHARPMATRRRPRQAPWLFLDGLGRRLASHPDRWPLRRQLPAPAGLLHRRPLLSPGRPLHHQTRSLLARFLFTDRPPPSSTSTSGDSSPLLVLLLPCPREPCPLPPW